jgi:hypothetical protein
LGHFLSFLLHRDTQRRHRVSQRDEGEFLKHETSDAAIFE